MKLWLKIEEFINNFLLKVFALIGSCFQKITPSKIKGAISYTKEKVKNFKEKPNKMSILKDVIDKIKAYFAKVGESFNQVTQKLKSIDPKIITAGFVFGLILSGLSKIKMWFASLKPTTIMGFFIGTTIGGLTILNIYTSSQNISRSVASAAKAQYVEDLEYGDSVSARPEYYKLNEKQFIVRNVHLPIYLADKKKIKKVRLDIIVTPSNRYIKEYFFYHMHLVHDRINSNLEPINGEFSMKIEGKEIIKDKIKRELDKLLSEWEIAGHIDGVHVIQNLGG